MKARDVMSSPVYFVSPGETVAHARHVMVKHRISRLLLMNGGQGPGTRLEAEAD